MGEEMDQILILGPTSGMDCHFSLCSHRATVSGCGVAGLPLRFLASSVPLPAVALMIPILYDRLIDHLSTN